MNIQTNPRERKLYVVMCNSPPYEVGFFIGTPSYYPSYAFTSSGNIDENGCGKYKPAFTELLNKAKIYSSKKKAEEVAFYLKEDYKSALSRAENTRYHAVEELKDVKKDNNGKDNHYTKLLNQKIDNVIERHKLLSNIDIESIKAVELTVTCDSATWPFK